MNKENEFIAHELKNALNMMMASCTMAQKHIDDRERVLDYLNTINMTVNKMAEMIDSAFNAGQKNNESKVLSQIGFTIDALEKEVKDLLTPLAMEKDIKFIVSTEKFKTRDEILKVPKLGAKAFEQCAGFLRIVGGDEILDNTSVHPESYASARKLLKIFKMTEEDVKNGKVTKLPELVAEQSEEKIAKEIGIGVPTMQDIVAELVKPGRDIREEAEHLELRTDVLSMEDLKEGMVLNGTVRNVIDFGAFVDIGVHQDGLVHISEICDRFIKHPSEELAVGQIVKVKVISLDLNKKRIGLSIRKAGDEE